MEQPADRVQDLVASISFADLFILLIVIFALAKMVTVKIFGQNKASLEEAKSSAYQEMEDDGEENLFPTFQGQPKYIYTMEVVLGAPLTIPNGPMGTRCVFSLGGNAKVYGPVINGKVIGPSADWLTIRPDGSISLDLRLMVATDDGEIVKSEIIGRSLRDKKNPNNAIIQSAVSFEAAANGKYSFLNQKVLTGKGVKTGNKIKIHYFDTV